MDALISTSINVDGLIDIPIDSMDCADTNVLYDAIYGLMVLIC